MQRKILIIFAFYLLMIAPALGQLSTISETINWSEIQPISFNGNTLKVLHFTNASNAENFGMLPVYTRMFPNEKPDETFTFKITNLEFLPFEDQTALQDVADIDLVPENLFYSSAIATVRKRNYSELTIFPLRFNSETGLFEKLISFSIEIFAEKLTDPAFKDRPLLFAENSVLKEGDWYKIAVANTGIHKVTFEDLTGMGMNFSGVNPDHIRIFGNGGAMLPERNGEPRPDDLQEVAIMMNDGADGSFDAGDHILFYAQGSVYWRYVPIRLAFEHVRHQYSDHNYYFITVKEGTGKRILPQEIITAVPVQEITKYNYFESFSLDSINLIRSGSEWYSHEFADATQRTYNFNFPYRNIAESVFIAADVAARSFVNSSFEIFANGELLLDFPITAVPPGSIKYANEMLKTRRLAISDSENISFDVIYNKPAADSRGWLNYIDVNVINRLEFHGSQMPFRNIYAMYSDTISRFKMTNVSNQVAIWDVTDHQNVKSIDYQLNGDTCSFVSRTDRLREFIAFNHLVYYQADFLGKIENQNLHALDVADFIIVSHPDFMEQAERLKSLHEQIDQMTIHLVTPQQIYNEFSSGKPDPAAIRDFVRMIYQKSQDPPRLKYLLLFGDGSYDPKNRIENNKNFILTYQSKQSLIYTTSYVTDDFYGLMDSNEGADAVGNLDIGIGRFPVSTLSEAKQLVDKYESYMTLSPENEGHWRNQFCFIADDEDDNLHVFQADTVLVKTVTDSNNTLNINKIYFDAYRQEKTSVGERYPQATSAINDQVNNGALFVNYTGHGGEIALAHERVVQIQDILSWNNKSKLPVVITATCEFAPYDNPSLVSAGENVLLNPNGGGIALMSTTRVAFASSNLVMNKRIYDTLFRAQPGNYPRLGDLIMYSKIPNNVNFRNFTLLGNPALKLAFPENQIIVDSINHRPVAAQRDTLRAGSYVSFSGYVATHTDSQILDEFEGILYPVFYDKAKKISTLANDPRSAVFQFDLQQEILYQGTAEVKKGRFSFSFVVPKDIIYSYGTGKLSLYATDGQTDAAGSFSGFVLGGFDENNIDQIGPALDIYLNAKPFINGSVTHNNPTFYADLFDESGINSFGVGIGHDIVAQLDGPVKESLILNSYFIQEMNDFRRGSIQFPFSKLPNGQYSLELKAWDMVNNSATAAIQFTVSDNISTDLTQVFNYPNPFRDNTSFTFQHNQFDSPLSVKFSIYDFNGRLAHTIGPLEIVSNGYFIEPIYWDGTNDGGTKLKSGLYVYRVEVVNPSGDVTYMTQKLMIAD